MSTMYLRYVDTVTPKCRHCVGCRLCGVQYVDALVGPVHAAMRRHRVEADVVERVVVLLHTHLGQVSVSAEQYVFIITILNLVGM